MSRVSRLLIIKLLWSVCLFAQCPSANFNVNPTYCINSNIFTTNTSIGAVENNWDFCSGDLEGSIDAKLAATISVLNNPTGLTAIEDNGNFYVFVTSRDGNSIQRIDLAGDLNAPVTAEKIINLGNVGGILKGPESIDFVKESGNWYGIVANFNETTNNDRKLLLLNFGSSLNTPAASIQVSDIKLPTGVTLTSPSDVKIEKQGTKYYVFIGKRNTTSITRLEFNNAITTDPAAGTDITVTGSNSTRSLSIIRECNSWYIYIGSENGTTNNNKIQRLSFGSDLGSSPAVSSLTFGASSDVMEKPWRIKTINENATYYIVISSSTKLYRINLGPNLSTTTGLIASTIGPLGITIEANQTGFDIISHNSVYKAFSLANNTKRLYRYDFNTSCNSSMATSSDVVPTVMYGGSGNYSISLQVKDAQGYVNYKKQSVVIENKTAPDIDFLVENQCVGSPINFTSQNTFGNINDYWWDFGDTNTASQPNPSNIYSAVGTYLVKLQVTASNACTNTVQRSIEIYNQPIPAFDPPSVNPFCTNQNYAFINSSIYDVGSVVTWQWSVNGFDVGTTTDLNYSFDSTSDQEITLAGSIPGCTAQTSQILNTIQAGPLLSFDAPATGCVNSSIEFTNTSIGSVINYEWVFGDGNSSSQTNPSNSFSVNGAYVVTLSATNSAGCQNTFSQPIAIYKNPQPTFFIDLPPFSCSGAPAQFHDNTPALSDSNISSWLWSFNDGTGSTAATKDPVYTYSQAGDFNVSLTVGTNYGCSSSIELPVTISSSPTADFSIGPSCLSTPTLFTNSSSPGIQSTVWVINGNMYTVSNPSVTFSNTGNFSASLTVKASNQCENTITKQIEVKPIPTLNFTTSGVCATQETTFTDQSTGTDLPASWNWNFGSGNTSSSSPTTYSFPSVGIFPVEMSVVTEAGCSYSFSKNISVATPPIASFTTTTSFGPPPLLVQFNSTSSNASALMWNFNDPAASSSSVPNPLFTFTELGDYDVELTAFNSVGCSDSFSKTINVLIPSIDLSLDGLKVQNSFSSNAYFPVLTIANHSNVNIFDITAVINGSSGTRISANLLVNLSSGSNGEFMVPIELRSKDEYLCVEIIAVDDSDTSNNVQCLNLSNRTIIVQPYPNPSNGDITFEALLSEAGNGSLRILDSKGRLVFKNEFPSMITGMNQLQMDLSGVEPGLYMAIWIINGQKSEVKFVVR